MNFSDLENIFDRAKRIRSRLDIKDGTGTNWSHTFEDNETHEYEINGVKPPEDIQDDIESAFVWLWSLKDYVKKYSVKKGFSSGWVETKINSDHYLCICADIANSVKHGGLDKKSRSNKRPRLGSVTYNVPQQAMERLTFYAFKVVTDIKDPDLVNLKMDVIDENDNRIGDAFKFLDYGIKSWNKIIDEVENNA